MSSYVSLGGNCSIAYNLIKLGKYNNRYPFDWCKISINQLNNVLENNFLDYSVLQDKKLSENHCLLQDNKLSKDSSLILTNNYKIKFAHEIINKYDINDFSKLLNKRIDQFLDLKDAVFIRLELENKSLVYYEKMYTKLYNNLLTKFKKFKLIIIINLKYKEIKLPKEIKIFFFKDYSADWRYPNFNWNEIFNDN